MLVSGHFESVVIFIHFLRGYGLDTFFPLNMVSNFYSQDRVACFMPFYAGICNLDIPVVFRERFLAVI